MASLSDEMKNKRDVRRRSSILIIDKDLGNYGLYKSILAMEYELQCVNSIDAASGLCNGKLFDVIVIDSGLDIEDVENFYNEVVEKYKDENPIFLVLEEPSNKESIVNFLSIGMKDYIAKPFSKDGITNVIYEQLKKRREKEICHNVLIIDKDFETLREMKGCLEHKYKVNIVNSCDIAKSYIEHHKPNLIICDLSMLEQSVQETCTEDIPILFMTKTPDAEMISKCAKFNPEGFLIKPIESDMLIKTLERIFLKESYTHFGR